MSGVRRASIADLEVIASYETELFGHEAWSREMVREELTADHRAYFALTDDEDRVIGYAGLLAVGIEGDVQTIAVSQEHRGHGHGRTLLETLIAEARERGVTQLFLEVRADNEVAQSLYRSVGFEQIGERPGYYQPENVSAIVMRLTLSGAPQNMHRDGEQEGENDSTE